MIPKGARKLEKNGAWKNKWKLDRNWWAKRLLLSMRSNRHRRLWTKWSLVRYHPWGVALEWLQNFKSTCTSLGIAPSGTPGDIRAFSWELACLWIWNWRHVLNKSRKLVFHIFCVVWWVVWEDGCSSIIPTYCYYYHIIMKILLWLVFIILYYWNHSSSSHFAD